MNEDVTIKMYVGALADILNVDAYENYVVILRYNGSLKYANVSSIIT